MPPLLPTGAGGTEPTGPVVAAAGDAGPRDADATGL